MEGIDINTYETNVSSIKCIFCNCLTSFLEKDPKKFFQHLLNQHDIHLNYQFILITSLMDSDVHNDVFDKFIQRTNMFTSDELIEINQKSDHFLFGLNTINMKKSAKVKSENVINILDRMENPLDDVYNCEDEINEISEVVLDSLNQNKIIDNKEDKKVPQNTNVLVQIRPESPNQESVNQSPIEKNNGKIKQEKYIIHEFKQEYDDPTSKVVKTENEKESLKDSEMTSVKGLNISNFNESFSENSENEIKNLKNGESYSKCDQCNILFFDTLKLNAHFNLHHKVKTQVKNNNECNICGKSFNNKDSHRSLMRHMKSIHGPKKCVQCEICLKKFKPGNHEQTLKEHHQRVHEKLKSHKCDDCDKLFYRKQELNVHRISNHTFGMEASCDQCDKRFKTEERVIIHKKAVHSGEVFTCDICKKELKSKTILDGHYSVCSKTTNFICTYGCEKKYFSNAYKLKFHTESIHLGIKNEICKECGKRFSVSKDLRIHIRNRHSGEKPFSCPFCDKAFATTSMLNRHKEIHAEVKQFPCKVCSKEFSQKSTLYTHMRIHTGEKFTCESCGKGFVKEAFLKGHYTKNGCGKNSK